MAKGISGTLVSVSRMSCATVSDIPKPGIGTGVLCLVAIGFLHRSLDEAHSTLLRRWVRHQVRILCAIFFVMFPFVTFARPGPRVSSKEVRALAAGFRIVDLMPCEKYVDPAAYSRRSLTWCRNRAEAEDDNAGTVGFLLSLSLPKNHRKVFATEV